MSKEVDNKDNIKDLINGFDKKFGKGKTIVGSNFSYDIPVIGSTGSFKVDDVLGCGGIPQGRMGLIYGPASGGKTLLALEMMASVQREGKVVAFVDCEGTYTRSWAEKIGIDSENVIHTRPDTGGEAFDMIFDLVKSNIVDLIVCDSITAMVTEAELEGGAGDAHMAQLARLCSQNLKRVNSIMNQSKVAFVMISQTREGIGPFAKKIVVSGGKSPQFYASWELYVSRSDKIGQADDPTGFITKIQNKKNKVGVPFRNTEINLYINNKDDIPNFCYGIDKDEEICDIASEKEIDGIEITKAGAWYKIVVKDLSVEERFQGKQNLIKYVKSNENVFNFIKEKVEQSYITSETEQNPKSFNAVKNVVDKKEEPKEKDATIEKETTDKKRVKQVTDK